MYARKQTLILRVLCGFKSQHGTLGALLSNSDDENRSFSGHMYQSQ
jgi:hypothetical protein